MAQETVNRVKAVDGIRALAALYVMIFHSKGFIANDFWISLGHFSVTVFIVMSGFCLMLPVVKAGYKFPQGFAVFMKRRAWRLLPAMYLSVVLFALLVVYVLPRAKIPADWYPTWFGFLIYLPMLQDFFINNTFATFTWTIAVEWHIYLLFPLLLWSWRKYGAEVTVILAGLITVPFGDLLIQQNYHIYLMPGYIFCFVLGMYAAHLVISKDEQIRKIVDHLPWPIFALALTGCFVEFAHHFWPCNEPVFVTIFAPADAIVGAMAFCWLLAVSVKGGGVTAKIIGFTPLAWIGGFSYSLYLVHVPLIQMWHYCINDQQWALYCLGWPAVILCAFAFSLIAERPFMRLRDMNLYPLFQKLYLYLSQTKIILPWRKITIPSVAYPNNPAVSSVFCSSAGTPESPH